jgi:hypothetical protein
MALLGIKAIIFKDSDKGILSTPQPQRMDTGPIKRSLQMPPVLHTRNRRIQGIWLSQPIPTTLHGPQTNTQFACQGALGGAPI